MKLNKDTRDLVQVGTKLRQKEMMLKVTRIIELPKGKQVTSRIIYCSDKVWNWRTIYAQPMSWYYGMEIVEE